MSENILSFPFQGAVITSFVVYPSGSSDGDCTFLGVEFSVGNNTYTIEDKNGELEEGFRKGLLRKGKPVPNTFFKRAI